ncbi:aspartate-semialdehyde dehydrogenase [candidate division TA06 bacterium]|nr:aspartate-semialdehyde dehydrogenase [candidate division TA06 bacterium]
MKSFHIAIVGATGLVGEKIREVLEERNFPINSLRLFSSERSKDVTLLFRGEKIPVETLPPLDRNSKFDIRHSKFFVGVDIIFFSAGKEVSNAWVPIIAKNGSLVIDNSPAFRLDPEVPLVVPEVNPEALSNYQKGIIANPNCSTIQMVVALHPLHKVARMKRIVVSTYQSVSGYGREAVEVLQKETHTILHRSKFSSDSYPFPHSIAFNIIPQIDDFNEKGESLEEWKMVEETRKILAEPDLRITATCVRVPVFTGHSEAVNVEFEKKITAEEAREILTHSPGVRVIDDPENSKYPLPMDAAGKDDVFVGRIREDLSVESGLNLWIVSDNLRKGAATNAIQIAEHLFSAD